MRTNVVYIDQTKDVYYEEKKVVVTVKFRVKIKDNVLGVIDKKKFKKLGYDIFEENGVSYIEHTTDGYAKCSDADEFDENIGFHLAMTRAQTKAFSYAKNFYNAILNHLYVSVARDLCDIRDSTEDVQHSCYMHVDKIIKSTYKD